MYFGSPYFGPTENKDYFGAFYFGPIVSTAGGGVGRYAPWHPTEFEEKPRRIPRKRILRDDEELMRLAAQIIASGILGRR